MRTDANPRRSVAAILTAYRLDIAGHAGLAFGAYDGAWVEFATLLSRSAMVEPEVSSKARAASVSLARELLGDRVWDEGYRLDPVQPPTGTSLEGRIRSVAELAEEAGAVNLADAMLVAYLSSSADVSQLEQGRIEAVRARLAWKTGNQEAATERYERTLLAARRIQSDELLVRGLIGRAVLARLAGNYPRSRDTALEALAVAAGAGMSRLAGTCHHMLMVCAAVSERFQEAVLHGWQAYLHATNDPILESEVLGNLGQLFLDLEEAQTAVAAFTAVVYRKPADRILVPALGGLALASARTFSKSGVFLAAERLATVAGNAPPYFVAVAYAELAEACELVGEPARAEDCRARALAIAAAHDYHEIPFRVERKVTQSPSLAREWVPSMEVVADAVRHLVHA